MIEELKEASAGYRTLIKMKLVEILVLLSRYYKKQLKETVAEGIADVDDESPAH